MPTRVPDGDHTTAPSLFGLAKPRESGPLEELQRGMPERLSEPLQQAPRLF